MCKQIAKGMMQECPICKSNDLVDGKYPENGYSAGFGWTDGLRPDGGNYRGWGGVKTHAGIGAIGCKSCGYVALFAPELASYDSRLKRWLKTPEGEAAILTEKEKEKHQAKKEKQQAKEERWRRKEEREILLRSKAKIDAQIAELERKRSQI